MTRFRPCIDLHAGAVKQIVGGTLSVPSPAPSSSTSPPSSTTASATPPNNNNNNNDKLQTNHISPHSAAHFARLYRDHNLTGGHMIMLGPGNETAAREALEAWPGGLQVGGGIRGGGDSGGAAQWIKWGASKVILTSWLFPDGKFSRERLEGVLQELGGNGGGNGDGEGGGEGEGGREKLVVDLSCRRVIVPRPAGTATAAAAGAGAGDGKDTEGSGEKEKEEEEEVKWFVAMDKWQTITDVEVCQETINTLRPHCSELLVHAADVEGLQRGIDEDLVRKLGEWCRPRANESEPATASEPGAGAGHGDGASDSEHGQEGGRVGTTLPSSSNNSSGITVTYAGGATSLSDLDLVKRLSNGWVDLTIGSALDVFGGSGCTLEECVEWNRLQDLVEGGVGKGFFV